MLKICNLLMYIEFNIVWRNTRKQKIDKLKKEKHQNK